MPSWAVYFFMGEEDAHDDDVIETVDRIRTVHFPFFAFHPTSLMSDQPWPCKTVIISIKLSRRISDDEIELGCLWALPGDPSWPHQFSILATE